MNLEKLVAVSGMPGVYKTIATRNNGIIIEDLDSGKRRFASARKHQFTPLESVGIYTDDGDTSELKKVFQNILDQISDNPIVDHNSDPKVLHEYFSDILPNYDKDKVHIGDIKKVIKWFNFLNGKGFLNQATEEEKSKTEEEE